MNLAFRFTILLALALVQPRLEAQSNSARPYSHIPRSDISVTEKAQNFGLVYGVQWASYYVTQKKIIEEHGSFKNWYEGPTKTHFDKDHFDFNLFKHTAVGQYYFLFYRSRGYGKQSAFYWAFLSSLAFEFTIEVITEPPSVQDIYQTPVFGTILGVGTEKLSLYLHSFDTLPTTVLGYLFNPFAILPSSSYRLSLYPTRFNDKSAVALALRAEL